MEYKSRSILALVTAGNLIAGCGENSEAVSKKYYADRHVPVVITNEYWQMHKTSLGEEAPRIPKIVFTGEDSTGQSYRWSFLIGQDAERISREYGKGDKVLINGVMSPDPEDSTGQRLQVVNVDMRFPETTR